MGRPRAFDLEQATDQALLLFWARGYEGTTLEALTGAMGINRPSLYAAFGSKEELFQRALQRYVAATGLELSLQAETGKEAAFRLMRLYADGAGRPDRPSGCLLVNGALACSEAGSSAREALSDQRHFAEAALVKRLERARREGELGAEQRPVDLARYVWTVCFGLSVQAVGGATREQLRRVVDLAMRAWPA